MTALYARPRRKPLAQSNTRQLDLELVQDLHNRLRCLEGHIRGIERMLDDQATCEELIVQTSAVRAALNQINIRIIEGNFSACMLGYTKEGEAQAAIVQFRGALAQVLKNG